MSLAVARTSRWNRASTFSSPALSGRISLITQGRLSNWCSARIDLAHAAGADPPLQPVLAQLPGLERLAPQRADRVDAEHARGGRNNEHQREIRHVAERRQF